MLPSGITRGRVVTTVGGVAALAGGVALLQHSLSAEATDPPAGFVAKGATAVATISDVGRAAEVVEPECDCAPLWECMQKEEGECGLLEKQLRDCMARNQAKKT